VSLSSSSSLKGKEGGGERGRRRELLGRGEGSVEGKFKKFREREEEKDHSSLQWGDLRKEKEYLCYKGEKKKEKRKKLQFSVTVTRRSPEKEKKNNLWLGERNGAGNKGSAQA